MRKAFVTALFGLLAIGSARPAEATMFTLQSYSLGLHSTDAGGLALFSQNLLPAPTSFDLSTVGQSYVANLFRVGTIEPQVNYDDLQPRQATISFAFSQPLPAFGGTGHGISGALSFFGGIGYLVWDNPVTVSFGSSGLLQAALSQVAFGVPGSAVVSATFTLVRQDAGSSSPAPAGVPEPSTLLLMGAGFATLVGRQYRRRSA